MTKLLNWFLGFGPFPPPFLSPLSPMPNGMGGGPPGGSCGLSAATGSGGPPNQGGSLIGPMYIMPRAPIPRPTIRQMRLLAMIAGTFIQDSLVRTHGGDAYDFETLQECTQGDAAYQTECQEILRDGVATATCANGPRSVVRRPWLERHVRSHFLRMVTRYRTPLLDGASPGIWLTSVPVSPSRLYSNGRPVPGSSGRGTSVTSLSLSGSRPS